MYLNQIRSIDYLKKITVFSGILALFFGLTFSFLVGIIISALMFINFLYSWKTIKLKQFIFLPQIIHFIFGSMTPWLALEVFKIEHQNAYLTCFGWGLYFSSTSLTNELMDLEIDLDKNSSFHLGRKKTIFMILFLQYFAFSILNYSFLSESVNFFILGEIILTIFLIIIIKNLKNKDLNSQKVIINFRKDYRNLLFVLVCFWLLLKII